MKYLIIIFLIVFGALGFYLLYSPKKSAEVSPPLSSQVSPEPSKTMQWNTPPQMEIDDGKKYFAEMETSAGKMKIELFASETPVTVNNFVFLSRQGFYSETKFHRIIKGFMIQGGDPRGDGTGGPGYRFDDEPIGRDYERGTVAMANSGPDTNGSQFFIMHQNVPLPKNYVIFGKLVDGFAALDAIAETPVTAGAMGELSVPIRDVFVKSVIIIEE